MKQEFYVDEYGCVRRSWKKNQEQRQTEREESILQVLRSAVGDAWSLVTRIVRKVGYKQQKEKEPNIRVLSPKSTAEQKARPTELQKEKVQSEEAERTSKQSPQHHSQDMRMSQRTKPRGLPNRESMRQHMRAEDAKKRVAEVFESDIRYGITRMEGIDVYHISVDRRRNEILDNQWGRVPLELDITDRQVGSLIVRAIEQKESATLQRAKAVNEEIKRLIRLEYPTTPVEDAAPTKQAEEKMIGEATHIDLFLGQQAPESQSVSPNNQHSQPAMQTPPGYFQPPPQLPTQPVYPTNQALTHGAMLHKSTASQLFQAPPTTAPQPMQTHRVLFNSPASLMQGDIASNPFVSAGHTSASSHRKIPHRSASHHSRHRRHVERPQ